MTPIHTVILAILPPFVLTRRNHEIITYVVHVSMSSPTAGYHHPVVHRCVYYGPVKRGHHRQQPPPRIIQCHYNASRSESVEELRVRS